MLCTFCFHLKHPCLWFTTSFYRLPQSLDFYPDFKFTLQGQAQVRFGLKTKTHLTFKMEICRLSRKYYWNGIFRGWRFCEAIETLNMKCIFGMGQGKEIINPVKSANLQSFQEFITKYQIIMIKYTHRFI